MHLWLVESPRPGQAGAQHHLSAATGESRAHLAAKGTWGWALAQSGAFRWTRERGGRGTPATARSLEEAQGACASPTCDPGTEGRQQQPPGPPPGCIQQQEPPPLHVPLDHRDFQTQPGLGPTPRASSCWTGAAQHSSGTQVGICPGSMPLPSPHPYHHNRFTSSTLFSTLLGCTPG